MIVRFLTEDRGKGRERQQALKAVGQRLLLEMVPPDTIFLMYGEQRQLLENC